MRRRIVPSQQSSERRGCFKTSPPSLRPPTWTTLLPLFSCLQLNTYLLPTALELDHRSSAFESAKDGVRASPPPLSAPVVALRTLEPLPCHLHLPRLPPPPAMSLPAAPPVPARFTSSQAFALADLVSRGTQRAFRLPNRPRSSWAPLVLRGKMDGSQRGAPASRRGRGRRVGGLRRGWRGTLGGRDSLL